MIRGAGLAAALALAAAPALAEGGPIRSGEHAGFSRIVLVVDPTTEWSLETAADRATISFPSRSLAFGTEGVFDKIPTTRITSVSAQTGPAGTRVEVGIGCDCRVSTAFVGARYLALDVADRDFMPPAGPTPATPDLASAAAAEDPAAREAREGSIVASAEQILIEQIERAATQGLIRLSGPGADGPEPTETAAADPGDAADTTAPELPPPPAAAAAPTLPGAALPEADVAHQLLAGLAAHEQIEATTVFDRDSHQAAARMAEAAKPPECIADERLDVGAWSNGAPLFEQAPALRRRLLGEFDQAEPEAVAALARLYVRFGFGAEAGALLGSIPADFPDRALLGDLAAAIESRPLPAADGPLGEGPPCPGRHGLWQAVGGVQPAFRDPEHFATVQAAFGELPPDLRAMIGPRLVGRLIDAGRPAEARQIHDTAARPGTLRSAELELAAARLAAAEGRPAEAARALGALVEGDALNGVEALRHLVRLALDTHLPIPDRLVTDLRAAALQHRNDAGEADLRALLAEALAARNELGPALAELGAAKADLPDADALDALAVEVLASADPAAVGPAAYAEAVLARSAMIGPEPRNDPARRAVARRLIDLGLPQEAIDLLAPALGRGEPAARQLAADADLRLGRSDLARARLAGVGGAEAATLRARAFALDGNFAEAVATLTAQGLTAEASAYAWPSGDWPFALGQAGTPERLAMTSYMAARAGGAADAPAADPASLGPAQAFVEPLPGLDTPSLSAARRLLAAGRQVGGFVEGLLTEP